MIYLRLEVGPHSTQAGMTGHRASPSGLPWLQRLSTGPLPTGTSFPKRRSWQRSRRYQSCLVGWMSQRESFQMPVLHAFWMTTHSRPSRDRVSALSPKTRWTGPWRASGEKPSGLEDRPRQGPTAEGWASHLTTRELRGWASWTPSPPSSSRGRLLTAATSLEVCPAPTSAAAKEAETQCGHVQPDLTWNVGELVWVCRMRVRVWLRHGNLFFKGRGKELFLINLYSLHGPLYHQFGSMLSLRL